MSTPRLSRLLPAAAALALAVTLGACSAGSRDSAAGSAQQVAPSAAVGGPEFSQADGAKAAEASTTVTAPMLIKQAQVDMTVDDITVAAGTLRSIATANGGSITNEHLVQADTSSMPSSLTLSVPADKLDTAMDQVAAVGTVVSRSASSDDVTSQYVDTQARIESMQRSVDRLRTLIDQATTVTDIAAIESELTRRETDLDGLKAQMKSLEGQVAQSSILVSLSTRPEVFEDGSGGFVSGLKAGWRAFLTSIGLLLTVLGALLPFAVAFAVVFIPLLLVLRSRRRNRAAGQPPAPGQQGPMPPSGPAPAPMTAAGVGAPAGPVTPSSPAPGPDQGP